MNARWNNGLFSFHCHCPCDGTVWGRSEGPGFVLKYSFRHFDRLFFLLERIVVLGGVTVLEYMIITKLNALNLCRWTVFRKHSSFCNVHFSVWILLDIQGRVYFEIGLPASLFPAVLNDSQSGRLRISFYLVSLLVRSDFWYFIIWYFGKGVLLRILNFSQNFVG